MWLAKVLHWLTQTYFLSLVYDKIILLGQGQVYKNFPCELLYKEGFVYLWPDVCCT